MNVVDLFSGGAGGWSLGLHRAKYRTVAAAEIHPWRRLVFGARWGVPVCDDVRKLNSEWYRQHVGSERPFLVCGSPPCKEYSAANSIGRGLDSDDLFLEAVRVVAELGPDWAAFENSPRVRTLGYDRIAYEMEAIGFACWPLVVGLANAGAAHRRQRLWLLCANGARQQGRPAGQPREAARFCSDASGADGSEEGTPGSRRWWERRTLMRLWLNELTTGDLRMDAHVKAKWVEALRSGDYKQGDGLLHDVRSDAYCCLGVLCRVMGAEFGSAVEEDDDPETGWKTHDYVPRLNGRVLGEDEELKKSFAKEIGIPDQFELISMNDGLPTKGIRQHSFAEIADYIEKNL